MDMNHPGILLIKTIKFVCKLWLYILLSSFQSGYLAGSDTCLMIVRSRVQIPPSAGLAPSPSFLSTLTFQLNKLQSVTK